MCLNLGSQEPGVEIIGGLTIHVNPLFRRPWSFIPKTHCICIGLGTPAPRRHPYYFICLIFTISLLELIAI